MSTLIDFNASAAAVRAGFSPRTTPEIGYENLRKPHIMKKIVARRDELAREARVGQERVLAAECCIAFSGIRKLFDGETLVPLENLPEKVARAIASFEIKELDLYADGERVETITTYKYKFGIRAGHWSA